MLILKSLLLIIPFAVCYLWAGQGPKYMRRFVGPSVLGAAVIVLSALSGSFHWLVGIGSIGYIAAANGFAYGTKYTHDKQELKILFRGLCGASYGLCGLIIGIGCGHGLSGALQLVLSIAGAIGFGVFNPFNSLGGNKATMIEDLSIALCYVALLPFII